MPPPSVLHGENWRRKAVTWLSRGPMPMPRHKILEVLTEGVGEHPAVQAWLQIQSDSWEPGSLEVLQQRRYSTVYRLNHVKQGVARVIAKRCRVSTARIEHTIY